jgi:hypothetical protein
MRAGKSALSPKLRVRNHLLSKRAGLVLIVFVSGKDPETKRPIPFTNIAANLSIKSICEPASRINSRSNDASGITRVKPARFLR